MLALLLAALTITAPGSVLPPGTFRIAVDSAHHEVLLTYIVPSGSGHEMPSMEDMGAMHGHQHGHHVERLVRFTWPVDGWLRGARVQLADSAGQPLSQRKLHHINLLNFSRRGLLNSWIERTWAAGGESKPVMLPATIGVPLQTGASMGMVVAYVPSLLPAGSQVTVRIRWTPTNQVPQPKGMFPVMLDVNFRVGQTAAYDLPAGPSERSAEFVWPLTGRILGVGGHLHDYGVEVRLEDVASGAVLVTIKPVTDSTGHVLTIPQVLFGVGGRGRRIMAGRRYRIVAVYNNTSGHEIPGGAMGELGVGFMPDHPALWPKVDPANQELAIDLQHLDTLAD